MKTKADYFALYDERPVKFTAEDVRFTPQTIDSMPCCSCINWFYSPAMEHSVCQVFRPEGKDENVPSIASCMFWTRDNESFPKLEE